MNRSFDYLFAVLSSWYVLLTSEVGTPGLERRCVQCSSFPAGNSEIVGILKLYVQHQNKATKKLRPKKRMFRLTYGRHQNHSPCWYNNKSHFHREKVIFLLILFYFSCTNVIIVNIFCDMSVKCKSKRVRLEEASVNCFCRVKPRKCGTVNLWFRTENALRIFS